MSSSCRLALFLALGLAAATAASAQSSSSSSPSDQSQAQPEQNAAQSAGALSVQARIKARRAKRRAAAIHEAYSHRYEAYTGIGVQRFEPGPGPVVTNPGSFPHGQLDTWEYAWNVGLTRYRNERLGWNVDGRGYYSTAYVGGPNAPVTGIYNVAISQYALMAGPSYRFYLQPKFSVSVRGLAGFRRETSPAIPTTARFSLPNSVFGTMAIHLPPLPPFPLNTMSPRSSDCASPPSTTSAASARQSSTAAPLPSASSTALESSKKQGI